MALEFAGKNVLIVDGEFSFGMSGLYFGRFEHV